MAGGYLPKDASLGESVDFSEFYEGGVLEGYAARHVN